jgi:adenosine deaminase
MRADCHRHFAGSISVDHVWDMICRHNAYDVATDVEDLKRKMTFNGNDEHDFDLFLKKFNVFNKIPWTMIEIEMAIDSIARSLRDECIDYCELKFSLYKYGRDHIIEAAETICNKLNSIKDVMIVPVLSFKYESEPAEQIWLSNTLLRHKVSDKIQAIDFVGNERCFEDVRVRDVCCVICEDWISYGKIAAMHVGESQTGTNVRKAIKMGVRRICHGIRAIDDDPGAIDMANEYGVCFDMALSSNYRTGVIRDLRDHPIKKFLRKGCEVTIGTDDPVVLNTTLTKEYDIAKNVVGLSSDEINLLKTNAAERRS